jgi:DNA-binding transcriptional regulator YiaG
MTATEYRDAIAALGLTQAGAAEFLGVSLRTSQNWALGEARIPVAVAKLLDLTIKFGGLERVATAS